MVGDAETVGWRWEQVHGPRGKAPVLVVRQGLQREVPKILE